jgi:hypothetical protein
MRRKREYKVTYAYTDGSAVYVRTEKVVKRKGGMHFPRCVDDLAKQLKEDNPDKKGLVMLDCIDLKTKAAYKLINSAPLEEKKMSKEEQVWFQVEDPLPNDHAEEVHVKDNTCFQEGDYLEVMTMHEDKLDPLSLTPDKVIQIRTAVLMNRSAIQRETKALEALKSMSEEDYGRLIHQEPSDAGVYPVRQWDERARVTPYIRSKMDTQVLIAEQERLQGKETVSFDTIFKAFERSIKHTIVMEKERQAMSHEENQPAKQTWLEQLQDIKTMLSEGHKLMANTIGIYLKESDAKALLECHSDRMDEELEQVALSVRNLVDAIANVHDRF